MISNHMGLVPLTDKIIITRQAENPDDMIVDMVAIDMRADNKRVSAFQKTLSEFISDPVRLFRCNLSGLK